MTDQTCKNCGTGRQGFISCACGLNQFPDAAKDLTSPEAVERAIGMCRAHGLHGTEATLRALSAAHAAAIVRERDANAKAMQHLRRANLCDPTQDERVKALVEAARPFSAAVFNDNGDVTISTGHLQRRDWINLCAALRALEQG